MRQAGGGVKKDASACRSCATCSRPGVLMGNSSFNTGTSISAGLPVYARNRLAAFAEALAKN